jgi:NAD(P)H-dependent flavin oxidoreductase YrpB (nitropropane dioxygenase family)
MIATPVTKLLGIRVWVQHLSPSQATCSPANENRPIVQGGMQWVGVPSLAAAVSNAGGLGRSAMSRNALT